MHPYLFSIPLPFLEEPFHLRSFGVLVACGFLFGAHVLQRLVARYGDDPEGDPERVSAVLMWILIGVFGGARLMYVTVEILRESPVGQSYLEDPLSILFFWEGGLVMYGGLAGGILAGVLKGRAVGLRVVHVLDMAMVATFAAQAIGRVGCLMVGDDYGRRVPEAYRDLPFPITVHVPDPLPEGSLFGAANAGEVLWATQAWMSLNALLLALVAYWLFRRRAYPGQTTLLVVLLYAIGRYSIEVFRGDEVRGMWFDGAMSTSQLISVAGGLAALVLLVRNRGRREDPPRARVAAGG
jgi:phosphatidylglycerol:prolipoprotein diacylglycerol transferase